MIFVSGNHDPQLGFPGVRIRLRERLANAAGHVRFGDSVLFRTWFWQGPDGIHVEHGNQYDTYCSFRYPMAPFLPDEGTTGRSTPPSARWPSAYWALAWASSTPT